MRIKEVSITPYLDKVLMTIAVDRKDGHAVQNIIDELGVIDGEYDVTIKKRRQKRSKDSNAYMWELVGQIAERIKSTPQEVYRDFVKDYGIYEIVPVREDHIEHWLEVWGGRGAGWICEDLGECRNTKGYHNMKSYYGTSVYNSAQMARLIDGVVREAKGLGIETLTPRELQAMIKEEKAYE